MTEAAYLDTHELIVGTSGAGKTVTAKDQVEQLLEQGRHTCIVDPTGVWFGLRTAADGDGPGFPIPIFGGPNGDVPITFDQGGTIGAIIAEGVSAIIDLSLMDSDEQQEFVHAMIAALRKKPRGNFHLVVDEADEFAPQTSPSKAGEAAKRQMEWIAKRGRVQGFVLTAITQRVADIAKSVISQMQTVIAHQLIEPASLDAIRGYLKAHADKDTLSAVMESLPGLARGERWIYSPRLRILERGVSPMPRTFDSSRTPAPGEQAVELKMLAQIDLGAIKEALAPPKVDLETDSGSDAQNMRVPMHDAERAALQRRVEDLETERDALRDMVERKNARIEQLVERVADMENVAAEVRKALDAILPSDRAPGTFPMFEEVEAVGSEVEDNPSPHSRSKGSLRPGRSPDRLPATLKSDSIARPGPTHDAPTASTTGIPASQQRVLDAIAWWEAIGIAPVERNRASVIAGLSPKASTFGVYVSKLAQAGLVDTSTPGSVCLTEAGRAAANSPGKVNKHDVAIQARSMLKPAAAGVFDKILAHYPNWIDRGELADECGLSRTASTLGVYISESSKLGFVETKPGKVRIADWVMP